MKWRYNWVYFPQHLKKDEKSTITWIKTFNAITTIQISYSPFHVQFYQTSTGKKLLASLTEFLKTSYFGKQKFIQSILQFFKASNQENHRNNPTVAETLFPSIRLFFFFFILTGAAQPHIMKYNMDNHKTAFVIFSNS